MKVECPRCKTNYRINDRDVPNGGAPVECIECSNIFTIFLEPLSIEMVRINKDDQDIGLQELHEDAELVKESEFKQEFNNVPAEKEYLEHTEKSPFTDIKKPIDIKQEEIRKDIPEFKYYGEEQRKEIYLSEEDSKISNLKSNQSLPEFDTSVSESFSEYKEKYIKQDDIEEPKITKDFQEIQKEEIKEEIKEEFVHQIPKPEEEPVVEKRKEEIVEEGKEEIVEEKSESTTSLEDFFNISKSPEDQAKIKAKNIIKELKLYFPDAADKAASTGKVPDTLVVEIKKALQYYKSEVAKEVDWKQAMSFFRDSINDIIGNGRKLFK